MKFIEPKLFVNGWRFLNLIVLIHIWVSGESTTSSFILILLLLVLTSLRWRFNLPVWSVGIDVFLCVLYAPFTNISYYGLSYAVFELALQGKWLFSLLFFMGLYISPAPSGLLFWYFLQALFFGIFAFYMLRNQQSYKREADEQRRARHESDRIRLELLEANQAVSQQAELMERYRISRELHDHLGHDLTGALLALQAHEVVQDPREADKLLDEVKKRLERSTTSLRETVHNLTPTTLLGVDKLEYIIRNFQNVEINWEKSGNMLNVPAHVWGLLEACLKEALTNIARHSNASKVDVDLHVTETIARLRVQDNGTITKKNHTGSGLRSLQMRARSLGGSVSIDRHHGFLLVCVIPLGDIMASQH